ncbi:unnamed protein product [Nippostrongylus brasiliensis]|uniref:G_PROTEIN_RECEP_F1_2 domain-containing protein n=1 Tax=Nippostrongylus brasiliensis TaxID=27835 RepID=A0A0N4Y296_NIPBR|nr:unnamed protein product [Nippostrongylus brasiliensis]
MNTEFLDYDEISEQYYYNEIYELDLFYRVEKWLYGIAFVTGVFAFTYTIVKLCRSRRKDLVLAARLFTYKVSLTAADSLWYGGDLLCRTLKFLSTFGFHLTANMQALVSIDRLYITTRMNKIPGNNRKKTYNTGFVLAVAWILALVCALPQLFVFREGFSRNGFPQCIAVWWVYMVQARVEYAERKEQILYYERYTQLLKMNSSLVLHPNGTLRMEEPLPPPMSVKELEAMNDRMIFLEQLYNGLHLTMIYVLPYLLELFSYTCILYVLKGAKKGEFMTLKDLFRQLFCCKSAKSSTELAHSSDLPIGRVVICSKSTAQRASFSEKRPSIASSSNTPWVTTLDSARKNARKKAFTMLSLNLILWGPYCILGIINATTVFEGFAAFQFVSALVVFNAISNIIL